MSNFDECCATWRTIIFPASTNPLLGAQKFNAHGTDAGPFAHLALSFKLYPALGLAASAPADVDFPGGMKSVACGDGLNVTFPSAR